MTIEELSARLEKVERANRRMRTGGFGLLVLVAAGVAMGLTAPAREVVKADGFEVKGANGNPIATLDVAGLTLFDAGGKRHAMFGLDPTGSPGFILFDGDGKIRADFGVLPNGATRLILKGTDGKPRVHLGVQGDGAAGLILSDKDGKEVFKAPPK